ncbi:hypothetical protein J2W28_000985 [Variovorax boronicumulans]|uniref:hypothetical protein n=1 Tax=Variovorax boronicumulans TaxID=436515 RepID=UPI00277ED536|nr:hypothetical protein [Variovorax boronicumulans]MDP9991957.1 hypothetical protein [Variovorax boronicumulans]MDQ0001852.1 hypothetical protein [Variovorax boronicumulans]
MTVLTQVAAGTGAITDINSNFKAVSQAGLYGRNDASTSGLSFGFYGGFFKSINVSDGAVTLANNTTNYVVADASTGAVSTSTGTTNWNNSSGYVRLHKIVTASGSISSREDHRPIYSAVAGGTAWGDLTGVPSPISNIAALTDPGADRLLFWDDSAGVYTHLTLGTGLSITGTTINASGGASTRDTVTALSTSGSVGIDCSLGDYFTLALTGNVSGLTFSNLPGSGKGASLMIRITQDSTARTVAWPASFKWAAGVAGAVSTGSGAIDILAITTFDNGTTWEATLAKAFA